jgi:hypothetical protein
MEIRILKGLSSVLLESLNECDIEKYLRKKKYPKLTESRYLDDANDKKPKEICTHMHYNKTTKNYRKRKILEYDQRKRKHYFQENNERLKGWWISQ